LENIIISYLFRSAEKRLDKNDVLKISNSIIAGLLEAYGEPVYGIPWDGQAFNISG
jgi:hypothetical protein